MAGKKSKDEKQNKYNEFVFKYTSLPFEAALCLFFLSSASIGPKKDPHCPSKAAGILTFQEDFKLRFAGIYKMRGEIGHEKQVLFMQRRTSHEIKAV